MNNHTISSANPNYCLSKNKFGRPMLFIISLILLTSNLKAQVSVPDSSKSQDQYVITKIDGTEYIGTIINDDGREVLIETSNLGKIYIPKSDIKSMVKIEDDKSVVNGEYSGAGPFTTRYAFTTNALPIVKGENYTMINLFGPEVHFAVSNNINLGVMTTWIGSPLAVVIKYSFKTEETKVNYSIGTMLGTSGYLNNFQGFGGLHWLNVTLGDRKNNITFSGGYAYVNSGISNDYTYEDGIYHNTYPTSYTSTARPISKGPMFSVAGIFKVGAKASIFFDSMVGIFNHTTQEITYNEITPTIYDPSTGTYIPTTFDYIVTSKEESQTSLFIMPGM